MKTYQVVFILLFWVTVSFGCSKKSKYEKMVERELSSNITRDSLFLGFKLGMTKKEYYDRSWNLNQKKLIRQGPGRNSVRYELKDLPHPAIMYFSPKFWKDKIYQMKIQIKYKGWAPWNKNLSADSLQVDILQMMEQWYGDGFITVNGSSEDPVYIKVDGNREIRITNQNKDESVWVYITDLIMVQQKNKAG